jgi:hypothetical protein
MPPPGRHQSDDGSWGWSAEGGPQRRRPAEKPPGLEPLSRRLLQVVGVLSALLIASVVYAWGQGGENSLNPIAEAATRTQSAPGARLAIRAVYTSPLLPQPLTAHGAGVYNGRSGRSRDWLEMQVPGTAASIRFEGVGDSRRVFVRSPVLSPSLPPGDRWMKVEPGVGHSPETTVAGNSDARGQLELLRAVGADVQTVGRQEVRGVETTRYRGHFDLRGYASKLNGEGRRGEARQYERLAKAMPSATLVEVWVDGKGLVRQARMKNRTPVIDGGPAVTMDMTIAYYDFGASPRIALPGAGESFDATLIGRAALGLLNADSVEVPHPPVGARPLSGGALHARAEKVCQGLNARISAISRTARPLREEMQQSIRAGGLESPATLNAFRRASFGFYEPAIRILRRGIRRLGRLAPPAAIAAPYRRLVRLSMLELDINLAATRAAEIGEFKLGHQLNQRLRPLGRRSRRIAKSLGLGSCGEKSGAGAGTET